VSGVKTRHRKRPCDRSYTVWASDFACIAATYQANRISFFRSTKLLYSFMVVSGIGTLGVHAPLLPQAVKTTGFRSFGGQLNATVLMKRSCGRWDGM